jgi:uncharacterized protein (DUF1501 family)
MTANGRRQFLDAPLTRRSALRAGVGLLGLSLPHFFALRPTHAAAALPGYGKAKSCIVLYCWGGMSQLETWDPKPDAPPEIRGDYRSIQTATPGVRLGEYMPLLARQTERLAIVRSMHHRSAAHGKGMYWNITGHEPADAEQAVNQPPTRADWPCLGAMVARLKPAPHGLPGSVQVPYPLVDNHTLQAGDSAGWLGQGYDPVIVRPAAGRPYGGVSRDLGVPVLKPADDVDPQRLQARLNLANALEADRAAAPPTPGFDHYRQMAYDMLSSAKVRAAFDVTREEPRLRDRYGDHICGQSVLLARRLTEAGVSLVSVICAAGDLNNAAGDHWDTHSNAFNRLRNDLLPPFERALSALLDDLADRGRLDETLVVVLTEFGRTPKWTGTGRDHYPLCYSVALAGGGVRGGQVYGRSDRHAALPQDQPTGPAYVHATIFHALGIPLDTQLIDNQGRKLSLTDGTPLPLF